MTAYHFGKRGAEYELSILLIFVLRWSLAYVFLEDSGKMALGGKTQIVTDGDQALIRVSEQAGSLLAFFREDKVGERHAGFLFEFS